jgi:hypothetical protein
MAVKKSVLTPVMTLEGHEPYIYTLLDGDHHEIKYVEYISYFPDGKQMISGSWDKTIRRWDLREGKEIKEAREVCEERISAVGVSRDGRWVVTAVRGVLKVSEVETGIVRTFHDGFSTWIDCIDISADSMLVAVGSMDSQVRIWSLDTGKLVAGPFKSRYGDDRDHLGVFRFSEDSKKLAVMSIWGKCLQVWDVQAQKLDPVTTKEFLTPNDFSATQTPPIFWTTKDKSIIASPGFAYDSGIRKPTTIYEFDASTLQTVGDPFEGHTSTICGLALSSDCVLLASASYDSTINLWSFKSRQLLASFDVPIYRSLIFSPDSCQLAYTSRYQPNIYVCDIPINILTSLGIAKQKSRPESAHLSKLLNSDATRHVVRRKPVISVVSPAPRPLTATIDPPQPIFLGFLRKFLPSRTSSLHPIHTNEPRNPLDFSATAPLPRPLVHPHENPPTTQSSAPTSTSFKSRLRRLSTWWPLQTGHTSPAIVPVPHAQGKERNAAADAPRKDDEWIPSENYVSPPPSPNPDSRQPATAGQINSGEHGSGRSCFCF